MSNENNPQNIKALRHKLKLSQSDFIRLYLSENDTPLFSPSTYSNLENSGGVHLTEVIDRLSERFHIAKETFDLPSGEFIETLDAVEPELGDETPSVHSLMQQISDYLTDALLGGSLKPGSKLPSERNLAKQFQTGRSSLREALKVLNILGLLTTIPGQGTFLATSSSSFFLEPLSWTFMIETGNTNELLSLRNMFETECTRLAAFNITAEELDELRQIVADMKQAMLNMDFAAFLDNDMNFHLKIAACSRNTIMAKLLETLKKIIRHISSTGMLTYSQMNNIYKEHDHIVKHLSERDDLRAADAMQSHLTQAHSRYQIP